MIVSPEKRGSLSSMSGVLDVLRGLNAWWFPLFVFPVMTLAALSAMFSTSDTNISSIFFIISYTRFIHPKVGGGDVIKPFKKPYLVAICIFLFSILVYAFARIWFNPTILQLVFSVFSNLVVIAPTIITATKLKPLAVGVKSRFRYLTILSSLLLGFVAYWVSSIIAMVMGEDFLWLSQLSIAMGLLGAMIPCLPLWISIFFNKKRER
jgi:hypothetical protein